MSEKLNLPLFNAQQGHVSLLKAWEFAKGHLLAGHQLILDIRPMSKTREQEEKYHAMIGEIALQAKHLGSQWSADDWKRLLLDKFARETGRTHGNTIPNLDQNGVVTVGLQSRNFTKSDSNEFIEWLYAWGTENGVQFLDTSEGA